MQGGRRQHGGDGNLTVGYIPMQLVPTPVMVISMAVALASQIALPRQIGQHFRQFHAPLPLQTRVGFGLIGPFAAKVSRIRTWLTPATAGGLAPEATRSPPWRIKSGEACRRSARTASNAVRLPWMSDMIAMRINVLRDSNLPLLPHGPSARALGRTAFTIFSAAYRNSKRQARFHDSSLARRNSGQQAAAGVQHRHRDSLRLQREIRTGQDQRPNQARPHLVLGGLLSSKLWLRSANSCRR